MSEEEKPRPFSVLRGNRHLKTGVKLPDSAFGVSPTMRSARSEPQIQQLTPRTDLGDKIRTAAHDVVRRANEQMLPDNERYPQSDEEGD